MAKIMQWDKEQENCWKEWVASRPPVIRELCERFPPFNLYRLKGTGQRVTVHSYSENGTLTVNITGEYNIVIFDRQVFGIQPDDLEECDLPLWDTKLGTVLTDEKAIDTFVDGVKRSVKLKKDIGPNDRR